MTKSRGIRPKRLPKLSEEELAIYRANPQREKELGITTYVVCRECGAQLQKPINGGKGHHLEQHRLTIQGYRLKWPGARVQINNPTPRSEITKQMWADPKIRQRISDGVRRYWQNPQAHKRHSKMVRRVQSNPEVRKRMSAGTRLGLSKPGVRQRMSASSRKYWDNPEVRKERGERTKLGMANPKVRQRMSASGSHHWENNPARKLILSNRTKQIWAERKKKLAEAERILAESHSSSVRVQKPAAFRRGGRPRKDIERRRVLQLKSQGKSWAQVQIIMNKETGQDKTANAYRNLVRRDHRALRTARS